MRLRVTNRNVLKADADFICVNIGSKCEAAQMVSRLKKAFPDVYRGYVSDCSTHDIGILHGHYMVCAIPRTSKYVICLYSLKTQPDGSVKVDLDAFKSALTSATQSVLIGWQPRYPAPFSVAIEVNSELESEMTEVVKDICSPLPGTIQICI